MSVIYVARSAALSKWASDVGQGKHVFKLGLAEGDAEAKAAVAAGWAGEQDWKIVATREAEGIAEEDLFARLGRKEKAIDPTYYPKLKGTPGVFRINLVNVQNSLLVAKAMSSEEPLADVKAKPKDIADYMIRNALPAQASDE
ncbi:hypothetical protein [Azospirillum sp. SYSU D00513]|uniref:hypothetical protein n=1 Tax=Azospirillum sp. SYSU D00513 TaxID=2812561 RepID=UPI001A95DA52|nr:hypothetical protein [Azospirillum sp. SYSU D00513]